MIVYCYSVYQAIINNLSLPSSKNANKLLIFKVLDNLSENYYTGHVKLILICYEVSKCNEQFFSYYKVDFQWFDSVSCR